VSKTSSEFSATHRKVDTTTQDILIRQREKNQSNSLVLNVIPDRFDSRDRLYDPGLTFLQKKVPFPDFLWPVDSLCHDCVNQKYCPKTANSSSKPDRIKRRLEIERRSLIRNQGEEGSCTGQALAAVIDILKLRREFGRPTGCYLSLCQEEKALKEWKKERISSRMLYEMARNFEFAPESQLAGSSIRNALKAFYHNGSCEEHMFPYRSGDLSWTLSVDLAKNARSTRLGSYYRLSNNILDWQAALNEVGAILVSGVIHNGWKKLTRPAIANHTEPNEIPLKYKKEDLLGGHAFAVVGYNSSGFYVLNSWGDSWGRVMTDDYKIHHGIPGVALWTYEDWQRHVMDGWVFRLSHPDTESIGSSSGWGRGLDPLSGERSSSEPRLTINGHYLNLGSTGLIRRGKYPCDAGTFEHTVNWLEACDFGAVPEQAGSRGDNYKSVAVCFMSGTADLAYQAKEVEALVQLFKKQGHYPVFVFWTYAQVRHLENIIRANLDTLVERYGAKDRALRLRMDQELSEFGLLFHSRMESKIKDILDSRSKTVSPCFSSISPLLKWCFDNNKELHFLAHSDGSLLLSGFIEELKSKSKSMYGQFKDRVKSYQLIAPTLNDQGMRPISKCRKPGCKINLVTLSLEAELADEIGGYQATYPQLVQNIFESKHSVDENDTILGLYHSAALKSKNGASSVYEHTIAERDKRRIFPQHFNMMSNRKLIDQVLDKM